MCRLYLKEKKKKTWSLAEVPKAIMSARVMSAKGRIKRRDQI